MPNGYTSLLVALVAVRFPVREHDDLLPATDGLE
jgi:hypothetical protein